MEEYKQACRRLSEILDQVPPRLSAIEEQVLRHRPGPGKWSKLEIIGHLIDSAANNHHRLIRARTEDSPEIIYDQDAWNQAGRYGQLDKNLLISFWEIYNRYILELLKVLHEQELSRTVRYGPEYVPLEALVIDYVAHMEHHLGQILDGAAIPGDPGITL